MQAIQYIFNSSMDHLLNNLNIVQTNKKKPYHHSDGFALSIIIPVPSKLGNLEKDFKDTYKRVLKHYNVKHLKDIQINDFDKTPLKNERYMMHISQTEYAEEL
jgi:hypothetical protein